MDPSVLDNGLVLPIAIAVAFAIGWLIKARISKGALSDVSMRAKLKLEQLGKQRNLLTKELEKIRHTVESQQAVISEREHEAKTARVDLNSALEKEKLLTKSIFTLRAEREDFKSKMSVFQSRMAMLQQQSAEFQGEFVKSRDFYVGELTKSFEKRKVVEEKLEASRQEHESFRNLLDSSKSEHEAVSRMLTAARERLEKFDDLEHKVNILESENAQLKHEAALMQQEKSGLQRNVAEYEELKVQNREMSQVLKSMENSRKQYEEDANRYREHADRQEKKSETLRMRLDEVEQNFMEIEQQQSKALKNARQVVDTKPAESQEGEKKTDNLQEIIGIGKVFEHTLHELGITTFEQIANFDVADIARVNSELKEFKGRMEQDDWIGQAKELHYQKYGTA